MFRLALLLLCLTAAWPAQSDSGPLDQEQRDWARVGELSRSRHLPVVVLISSKDCGYCERLKSEVLSPMLQDGSLTHRAVFGEVSRYSGGKIVDFDGERMRTRIFVDRYRVFAYPTLLFLDARGQPLHQPLVGYNGRAGYRPLLLEALEQSRAAMHELPDHGDTAGVTPADSDQFGS